MNFEPGMSVKVLEHQGCWVLKVEGQADFEEGDVLRSAMDETGGKSLPAMVVDLSALTFADTAFLHWLLEARRAHEEAHTLLILAGPLGPQLARLLTITGTRDHFTVADDMAAALALTAESSGEGQSSG
ncbi:STAS domain-containing protein [Streptomyces sp. NPDC060235]|uniref:STAS domain-containing protein n=1 Tax=Streptomyces sp. NPDC060235 TaxID=3347080 RepID=UPI003645FC28